MGVQLVINFDCNPSSTFRPGQVITGTVAINTSSTLVATGLTVSIHGDGYVHWTEEEQRRHRVVHPDTNPHHGNEHHHPHHHGNDHHHRHHHGNDHHHRHHHGNDHHDRHHHGNDHHHHHHHRNHDGFGHENREEWVTTSTTKEFRNQETYINSIINLPLLGSNLETYYAGIPVELQAGYYQQIPFSFQLPTTGLPSSCKLPHGGVDYYVEATLQIKHTILVFSTQSSKTVKKEFIILGTLELDFMNDALSPISLHQQTQFNGGLFCCCGGAGGEFQMDLGLARKGFVSGEPIMFNLTFSNETDVTVKSVKAHLDQKITFLTFGKEKVVSTRLCTSVYNTNEGQGRVVPNSNGTWTGQLRIPPDAYLTDLGGCRIITVKYLLTIQAGASLGRKSNIQVPITVGTVNSPAEIYHHI